QAFIADPASSLTRVQLCHRRFQRHFLAIILHLSRAHRQQPRRIQLCRHIRQLELYRLKLADRLAKLPPLLRILHRRVQSATRHPQAQRRNRNSSTVQHTHRILESLAFLAHHILKRNLAILKDQLRLVLLASRPKPRRPLLHPKPRDPPARSLLLVRHRKHHRTIRIASICDERLRPIQHPLVAFPHRRSPRTTRIRPRPRLRQTPRPQPLPARQLRNPPLPLFVISREHYVVRTKRIVCRHNNPHAPIHARQLLHSQHVFHIAHPRAAQLLGKNHTQQSHLAKLLHHPMRKLALLIPLRDMRSNLTLRKRPHRTLQLPLLLGQSKHFALQVSIINIYTSITSTHTLAHTYPVEQREIQSLFSAKTGTHPTKWAPHAQWARPAGQRHLDPSQSLIQIRHNILHVLNPNRYPHQTIRNPKTPPPLRPHCRVRHRRRMTNQRLHAAQRLGQITQLQPPRKGIRI